MAGLRRAGRRRLVAGRRVPTAALGQTSLGFIENDAPGVKRTRSLVGQVQHAMRNPPGATSRACGVQGGGFDCSGSSAWQSSPASVRAGLSSKWLAGLARRAEQDEREHGRAREAGRKGMEARSWAMCWRELGRAGKGERRKRLGQPTRLLGRFWVERRFWAELMRAWVGWVG